MYFMCFKSKKKKSSAKLNDLLEESGRMNLPLEPRNPALSSKECYFFLSHQCFFSLLALASHKGLSLAERERERVAVNEWIESEEGLLLFREKL